MCGHITSLLFSHKIGCSWLKYFFQSKTKRVSLESLHWHETCSMPSFARNEKVDACVALSYYKTITLSAFVYKLLHIFKWSNFRTQIMTQNTIFIYFAFENENIIFLQTKYCFWATNLPVCAGGSAAWFLLVKLSSEIRVYWRFVSSVHLHVSNRHSWWLHFLMN